MKSFFFLITLMYVPQHLAFADAKLSDADIRKEIIQQSISEYPSSCACPYNTDRAGHSCGRRSAYSKPGGYAPLCYPQDVSDDMVAEYQKEHMAH